MTEPDTYTDVFHITLDTPSSAVAVVERELAGLDRHGTLVGAGAGTWSSPAIDRALLSKTSIDYLDVHVYPLGPADVANLKTDVAAAKADHKPLVMDETWLNKPQPGAGLGPASSPEALKVKSYSFWEPLDATWLSAMVDFVEDQGFDYVAFFDGARGLLRLPHLVAGARRGELPELLAPIQHAGGTGHAFAHHHGHRRGDARGARGLTRPAHRSRCTVSGEKAGRHTAT